MIEKYETDFKKLFNGHINSEVLEMMVMHLDTFSLRYKSIGNGVIRTQRKLRAVEIAEVKGLGLGLIWADVGGV